MKTIFVAILEVFLGFFNKKRDQSHETEAKAAREAIKSVESSHKLESKIKEDQHEVSDSDSVADWNSDK